MVFYSFCAYLLYNLAWCTEGKTCTFGEIIIAAATERIGTVKTYTWTEVDDLCTSKQARVLSDPAFHFPGPARPKTAYARTNYWLCTEAYLRSLAALLEAEMSVWTSACTGGNCSQMAVGYTQGATNVIRPPRLGSVATATYFAVCEKGKWLPCNYGTNSDQELEKGTC